MSIPPSSGTVRVSPPYGHLNNSEAETITLQTEPLWMLREPLLFNPPSLSPPNSDYQLLGSPQNLSPPTPSHLALSHSNNDTPDNVFDRFLTEPQSISCPSHLTLAQLEQPYLQDSYDEAQQWLHPMMGHLTYENSMIMSTRSVPPSTLYDQSTALTQYHDSPSLVTNHIGHITTDDTWASNSICSPLFSQPLPSPDSLRYQYHEEDEEMYSDKPYARLIYEALSQAPNQRMMLREIYDWFEKHTTKPRESGSNGWQNSIRHNLSMNKAFENEKSDANGKGDARKTNSVWILTEDAIKNGVQSTTRYRKTGGTKRSAFKTTPAVQRQRSGAKGGRAARRAARLRRREKSHIYEPVPMKSSNHINPVDWLPTPTSMNGYPLDHNDNAYAIAEQQRLRPDSYTPDSDLWADVIGEEKSNFHNRTNDELQVQAARSCSVGDPTFNEMARFRRHSTMSIRLH